MRLFTAADVDPADAEVVALADGVRLAYRAFGADDAAAPTLVLLHGSPMAGSSMLPLARAVAAKRPGVRVLVPDLPGFGLSRQDLSDYSFDRHADDTLAWLDQLGIDSVDVVGYSMGGGVALQMYLRAPERLRSLTLLASIGVQELELLGDYHANHAVHGLQLAAISAVDWLVPHFGWLDDALINRAYARNFYDSDQRPLRGILRALQPPVLILHGEDDPLVPYAAAVEHARLVPQARLETFAAGHELPFSQPEAMAAALVRFLDAVAAGEAPRRGNADPARRAAAVQPFDRSILPPTRGVTNVLIGLGVIVFSYVSEDLATIAAGLAVSAGVFGLLEAVIYAMIGIYTGDILVYLSGRFSRRARRLGFIDKRGSVARAERWFERRGVAALLIARFVPGTRFPTFFAAGALGMSLTRFSVLLIGPALVWTPALVYLAARSGEHVLTWLADYRRWALPALLGIALALWLITRVVGLALNRDLRRLAVGRWTRLRRWEYWPSFVIYLPLLPYLVWLGLRHRSLLAFTAANPAMPLGGFVGESKAAILAALPADVLPDWTLIEPGEPSVRQALFDQFCESRQLTYPVVLKPDVGERGEGVLIARDRAAAHQYLAGRAEAVIAQRYVAGSEYGVFYYREPAAEHGALFAITIKEPLVLVGDGTHTLEQLILAHPRAVALAAVHCARHRDRLDTVIAHGESFTLVELGTHARGCVFRDGSQLVTPALTKAIDRISRAYEGFFFGRYDVRVPDVQALERGAELTVLELNGVTSEATNIYDPRHSYRQALGILAQQWSLAYRIGAANRTAGASVATPLALVAAWWRARRH